MTTALGPGKFYGSSLPRPRIYTDIKYNTDRVDPPVSVLDPFMSWAEEAHWSTGGLSFKRHRLQGRIEGDIEKIRNHIETNWLYCFFLVTTCFVLFFVCDDLFGHWLLRMHDRKSETFNCVAVDANMRQHCIRVKTIQLGAHVAK
ncbi:hypothetical protein CTI12_AA109050 [Artemisia annua]|uniref:Uncharacterized protein n=1 Tax=Artemisia annua TaxID=35608 RepID=A0A2U1PUL4_ARTAN|nr:hypothetical protein CTI12_AA109050 [Artemisia annua]